jgi:hypothetical protein
MTEDQLNAQCEKVYDTAKQALQVVNDRLVELRPHVRQRLALLPVNGNNLVVTVPTGFLFLVKLRRNGPAMDFLLDWDTGHWHKQLDHLSAVIAGKLMYCIDDPAYAPKCEGCGRPKP